MKKWLVERFLPMWAKETVLADNRELRRKLRELKQENRGLTAYIRGLEAGLRSGKRVHVYHHGGEQ